MRKNKLLLLLVLLMTAATGAWAQDLQVTKFTTELIASWQGVNEKIKPADLQAIGFVTTDQSVAENWSGAPEEGIAYMIFMLDSSNDYHYNYFEDGYCSQESYEEDTKAVFYNKVANGEPWYYTGSPSAAPAEETPLLTIESTDYKTFTSGSKTFDDKVTVTFSYSVYNYGDDWGWTAGTSSLLTVAGINGYTITSCKFYTANGTAETGYTVEGESPSVYLQGGYVYTDASKSVEIGQFGITKIEVYGAAPAASTYKVTMKDGVKDADKWTITPNEGLKEGDAVTLTYSGRLKVKGVKATSDAAPAAPAGNSVDLSKLTDNYAAQNGDVLTGETTSYNVTIAPGATVTLDGVTISSDDYYCIRCAGDATIILKDGSTNTLTATSMDFPALWIGDANTTLTIQGSTGVLNVTSGDYCAGIGGGYSNTNSTCGNIRIEGGVITAQGGDAGAGIGTDFGTAICGDIIITGGTITAKGGNSAAGIGTGYGSNQQAVCGAITIANTVTKVTATKGSEAPHSIGKGYGDNASCGTVTIGGTVYWQNNAAVGDGATYLAQATIEYPAPAGPAETTVTWNSSNVFNSAHQGDEVSLDVSDPLTYEGITISFSGADDSFFKAYDHVNQTGKLVCYGDFGDWITFTAPSGKKFCKIEIINDEWSIGFTNYGDWTQPEDNKIVWSGTAANAVTLGTVFTSASNLNCIVFTLVDAE